MKKSVFNSAIFTLGVVILSGCAQVKDTGRTIGHGTRDVAKAIGHASRDTAKSIGKNTKKIVNDINNDSEK